MHECMQNATLEAHICLPRRLAEGQWSLSSEYKDLIDWLLTQWFMKDRMRERMRERDRKCWWTKGWVCRRCLAGRVSDQVLETHLLHRSLHWFLILLVVSSGFKTAGFLSLPPYPNTPSVHPPLPFPIHPSFSVIMSNPFLNPTQNQWAEESQAVKLELVFLCVLRRWLIFYIRKCVEP